jgi:hypothetical protein
MAEIGGKDGRQSIQDFLIKAIPPQAWPLLDQKRFVLSQANPEVAYHPPSDQEIIPPHDITQEIDPVVHRLKPLPLFIEPQLEMVPKIDRNLIPPPEQFPLSRERRTKSSQ